MTRYCYSLHLKGLQHLNALATNIEVSIAANRCLVGVIVVQSAMATVCEAILRRVRGCGEGVEEMREQLGEKRLEGRDAGADDSNVAFERCPKSDVNSDDYMTVRLTHRFVLVLLTRPLRNGNCRIFIECVQSDNGNNAGAEENQYSNPEYFG